MEVLIRNGGDFFRKFKDGITYFARSSDEAPYHQSLAPMEVAARCFNLFKGMQRL